MKKIIKLLILMIFIIPLTVKADMGAPYIKEYVAIIDKVGGADYYKKDYYKDTDYKFVKIGTLDYNEEITIMYEEKANDKYYGNFSINDEYYYINLEDIIIKEETVTLNEEYKCSSEKNEEDYRTCYTFNENLVLKDEGIKMYKGPAYGYGEIQNIPKDTVLKYEYASEADGWYYTEYNGIKGWVCELNASIGTLGNTKYMTTYEVKITDSNDNELGSIPKNTEIKTVYITDAWSDDYYIVYNNIKGYIYAGAIAYNNVDTIELEYDTKMYDTRSYNSKILIDNIKKGTKITHTYLNSGFRGPQPTYAYVTINNISGWICVYDCELEGSLENSDNTITSTTTTTSTSTLVVKGEDTIKSLPGYIIVVLCVAGAIIVASTATVTVLLVNKNKKPKVADKPNIEDKYDEKKE